MKWLVFISKLKYLYIHQYLKDLEYLLLKHYLVKSLSFLLKMDVLLKPEVLTPNTLTPCQFEISAAIDKVVKDKVLKKKMITEGFKHAQNFTDNKIAKNLMQVYTDL